MLPRTNIPVCGQLIKPINKHSCNYELLQYDADKICFLLLCRLISVDVANARMYTIDIRAPFAIIKDLNSQRKPADVVPKSAVAPVTRSSMGAGLGGAVFQSLPGITLKSLSAGYNYTFAYHVLFIGFGIACVTGLLILLFLMKSLPKNEELHEYIGHNNLN